MDNPTTGREKLPFRLVMHVHVQGAAAPLTKTIVESPRPLYLGEISSHAEHQASWRLSTTPEPNWDELFAQQDAKKSAAQATAEDSATAVTVSDEDQAAQDDDDIDLMPEPTGVLQFITDAKRVAVVPREAIAYVEFVLVDENGDVVVPPAGWPSIDED